MPTLPTQVRLAEEKAVAVEVHTIRRRSRLYLNERLHCCSGLDSLYSVRSIATAV